MADDLKDSVDDFSALVNKLLSAERELMNITKDPMERKYKRLIGNKNIEIQRIDDKISDLKFRRPIVESERDALIKQLGMYRQSKT